MTELEKLLAQEVQVGTYHSTGTFSIQLSKARGKLQQYQLSCLAGHVLKLLQGVIQLEPAAIWIESDAAGFTLYWGDPDVDLQARTFLTDLERVVLGTPGPSKDLGIGLLGLMHREPDEVWWCRWEKGEVRELESLCGSLAQAHLRPPLSVFALTYAIAVRSSRRNLQVDQHVVAQGACFAPVQILWNGRLLSEPRWKIPGEQRYWLDYYLTQTGPLAHGLALKPLGACQTWTYPPEASEWGDFAPRAGGLVAQRHLQVEKKRRLDFIGGGEHLRTSLGAAIWVLRGESAPSQLWCVKHGVLLEPMVLPLPLAGLLVVMAAPDLEVDLGQFKALSGTQSYQDLKARLQAQALTLTRQVQPQPARRASLADGIPKLWTVAFLGGAALGTLCMPDLCLFFGPAFGAAAVGLAQKFKDMSSQQRQHSLQDRLEALLRALPEDPRCPIA